MLNHNILGIPNVDIACLDQFLELNQLKNKALFQCERRLTGEKQGRNPLKHYYGETDKSLRESFSHSIWHRFLCQVSLHRLRRTEYISCFRRFLRLLNYSKIDRITHLRCLRMELQAENNKEDIFLMQNRRLLVVSKIVLEW